MAKSLFFIKKMRKIFLILLMIFVVSCGTTKKYAATNSAQQDTTIVHKLDTTKLFINKDSLISSTDIDNSIIEEQITEHITEVKTDSTTTTTITTNREIKRTISKDHIKTDTTKISQSISKLNHMEIDSTNLINHHIQTTENTVQKNGFERVLYPVALIILLLIILVAIIK